MGYSCPHRYQTFFVYCSHLALILPFHTWVHKSIRTEQKTIIIPFYLCADYFTTLRKNIGLVCNACSLIAYLIKLWSDPMVASKENSVNSLMDLDAMIYSAVLTFSPAPEFGLVFTHFMLVHCIIPWTVKYTVVKYMIPWRSALWSFGWIFGRVVQIPSRRPLVYFPN